MNSKISTHSKTQRYAPARGGAKPAGSNKGKGIGARDLVALGGATVAGGAGLVYGGVEGLVKGAVKNYPRQISGGAKIGNKVLGSVGKVAGGLTATLGTGVFLAVAPVATVLGGPVGFVVGTGLGSIKNAGTSLTRANEFASAGYQGAKSTAGKLVGGAAGWVIGLVKGGAEAVLKGASEDGTALAKQGLQGGWQMMKSLPKVAVETYKSEIEGGARVFGGGGTVLGGTIGTVTATGTTLYDGFATSAKRGGQWANTVGGYILGEPDLGKPQRPAGADRFQS